MTLGGGASERCLDRPMDNPPTIREHRCMRVAGRDAVTDAVRDFRLHLRIAGRGESPPGVATPWPHTAHHRIP